MTEGQGMSLKLIVGVRRLGALHVLVHIKSSKHCIYGNNLLFDFIRRGGP